MKQGIDVSEWDYYISWNKVKTDFAIIRLGFGTNEENHNDKYFEANVQGCLENNMAFGVYIYSYATNLAELKSEVDHTKAQLAKINAQPFCVYIDMEDKYTVECGRSKLTEFALEFCSRIYIAGYKAGVYANQNWFKKYLDAKQISDAGYSLWCAKYSTNPPDIGVNYDIWQYTSRGKMPGISGDVDCNYMYIDLFVDNDIHKTVNELATEVIAGKWGNGIERKNRLTAVGYDYYMVQKRVNELLDSNLDQIARSVINGDWDNGYERKRRLEAAGYDYTTVQNRVNELLGL